MKKTINVLMRIEPEDVNYHGTISISLKFSVRWG